MRWNHRYVWTACALIVTFGCLVARAAETPSAQKPRGILDILAAMNKSVRPVEETMAAAMHRGDIASAEKLCRQLIAEVPFAPTGYYDLACVHALQGNRDDAFRQIEEAVAHGFDNVEHLKSDPDLTILRSDPRFAEIVKKAAHAPPLLPYREPEPFVITDQTAWVRNENTAQEKDSRLLRTAFRHAVPNAAELPVTTIQGEAGKLLGQWQKEHSIAGNVGDLYDNRDGGHSMLSRKLFPQLTWIEYAPEAKAANLHWGLQNRIHHDGVVLGNASVARTGGPFWRSMPRWAYENQSSAGLLYRQYRENKIYFYPGHVDHSPGRNGKLGEKKGGHGDVFFANTPYLIASQGSSGSDQVFMQAVAATFAAFRPETKKALVAQGLLCPATQMIFRMSNKPVVKAEDYLTGIAHPTVFEGRNLDVAKMVRMAHDMRPDCLPPLARIKVIEEDVPQPGIDYFDIHASEKLFDTPCAVARVMRGTQYLRRMVVSAEESFDVGGKPLSWHWQILRGDAEAIRIRALDGARSRVELLVPYHARQPIRPGAELESNRVDLAVFVHNGTYYSPPALVTFYTADNEQRVYDAAKRIQSVTYTGADEPGNYADPIISLPKSWKDECHYDSAGKLAGWTRYRGKQTEQFTSAGRLIVRCDDAKNPVETSPVRYLARPRGPSQVPIIVPVVEERK